jgi:S-ribosylhomocysteine lyase
MKKTEIESFTLDHDAVKAPYVRLIEVTNGPKGDVISNFDIRLAQPNEQEIPTAAMHTLEHLLAMYLRPQLEGYIDCSPYGCRTGFHLILWNEHDAKEVALALKKALEQALETKWEDVPGTQKKECGNYKDHSLRSAKLWAKEILDKGISSDAFERKPV